MSIESEIARITEAVSDQTALIGRIASALEGKAAGNGSGKPEQEKTVTITENGTVDVVPDEGHTLSKVTVDVNVKSSGGDEDIVAGIVSRTATEISSATAEEVSSYAFYNWQNLRAINFPSVKTVEASAFQDCHGLVEIRIPAVETLKDFAFRSCRAAVEIDMPMLTSIGTRVFSNGWNLKKVNLPKVTSISIGSFEYCYSLTAIILRSATLVALGNTNAFTGCHHLHGTKHDTYNPDSLKDGYFYVPKALIEKYKVATNWSTFATRFRAIEDYPDICG